MENIKKIGSGKKVQQVMEGVRESYAKIARGEVLGCGCGSEQNGDVSQLVQSYAEDLGYSRKELDHLPQGANLGLGCGNPSLLADYKFGETVLDLGSGAGVDCFNAARIVGDTGRVIGVDMTPEMLSKSRENALKTNVNNVEFRLGEIENLPVGDSEVDVIISNCVINLSPRKMRVYEEMFRTLKPGGRLAISDIVALKKLPQELQENLRMIAACVGGAQQVGGVGTMLQEVGFENIQVEPVGGAERVIATWFPGLCLEKYITSASITANKPKKVCC